MASEERFHCGHFSKHIVLQAVFWYLRYSLNYRDIEELMAPVKLISIPGIKTQWNECVTRIFAFILPPLLGEALDGVVAASVPLALQQLI